MDYKSINGAILKGRDLPKSFIKNKKFYEYILNNNIAYYYSSELSEKKTLLDKKIMSVGNSLNNKYYKTLKLLNKISKEHKIKFLLFKTYKYIPEVVDNDIDLFVREKDFYRFMNALEKEGFNCWENEHLKGICTREEFCNIEPRVNSEFHELIILKEQRIWYSEEKVSINGMTVFKVIKEIDLLHLILSILYNPNYLKLYVYILLKSVKIENIQDLIEDKKIKQDVVFLLEKIITKDIENKKFPVFINNIDFIFWWSRRIFPNLKLTSSIKIKHLVFFFYMKYSYVFLNKLVFKHQWYLN